MSGKRSLYFLHSDVDWEKSFRDSITQQIRDEIGEVVVVISITPGDTVKQRRARRPLLSGEAFGLAVFVSRSLFGRNLDVPPWVESLIEDNKKGGGMHYFIKHGMADLPEGFVRICDDIARSHLRDTEAAADASAASVVRFRSLPVASGGEEARSEVRGAEGARGTVNRLQVELESLLRHGANKADLVNALKKKSDEITQLLVDLGSGPVVQESRDEMAPLPATELCQCSVEQLL